MFIFVCRVGGSEGTLCIRSYTYMNNTSLASIRRSENSELIHIVLGNVIRSLHQAIRSAPH